MQSAKPAHHDGHPAAGARNLKIALELGDVALPEVALKPTLATYRGGTAEPLHGWYPYLEGYSPAFVTDALRTFAPNAQRVLDPFAGTGTTPLTATSLGCRAYYCELNPLLQFLIQTKAGVLAMPPRQRQGLATRLRDLAERIPATLGQYGPDDGLAAAYSRTFGSSRFFCEAVFEDCLKARSWLDELTNDDPTAAAVATVATVAALVPCSQMIRRGDLRFRRPDERDQAVPTLAACISQRLQTMAGDLSRLRTVDDIPTMVTEDAKRMVALPRLDIDAIVTSPPYLNGTNYYRNTKIELWFLRALSSSGDLARFRTRTVTAGINDVQACQEAPATSASVDALLRTLRKRAYDRRIPIMVSRYFDDMRQVVLGLSQVAKEGAPLVMDIGDSCYANTHVDTPLILADLLKDAGWQLEAEVPLRTRTSRSRQRLRQVLLVALAPKRRRGGRTSRSRPRWEAFKRGPAHQVGAFAKRNWGNPLHSLCSYQGKLKPAIAHHLVRALTAPGDRLLDPFGGVGTVAFEAALHGVAAYSFDISPVAVSVAAGKLAPAAPDDCLSVIEDLRHFLTTKKPTADERHEAELIQFNGPLPDYFHPRTLDEVILARRFFRELPRSRPGGPLVLACLLHILHGNRPYALSRRSHPITPFAPTGDVEYKDLAAKLGAKVQRSLAATRPATFVAGKSLFQDATGTWPDEVDQLDAVVTSPPFFDSTRFYLANWMRLWFAGWSRDDFKLRPGRFVDERQKSGFEVYRPVFRQARERLRAGGACLFHVGKSRKCDMAEEIARIARPWFRNVDVFRESVGHCESHGVRDKGTVVEHTYVLMT